MQLNDLKCQKLIYPILMLDSRVIRNYFFTFFPVKNEYILFILKGKLKMYDFVTWNLDPKDYKSFQRNKAFWCH